MTTKPELPPSVRTALTLSEIALRALLAGQTSPKTWKQAEQALRALAMAQRTRVESKSTR